MIMNDGDSNGEGVYGDVGGERLRNGHRRGSPPLFRKSQRLGKKQREYFSFSFEGRAMYPLKCTDPTMTTLALLHHTWTVVIKAAQAKLAKVGLTPEKAAVLWVCRDYPGTLTPSVISRLFLREGQSVAGLLNRMEEEGLVNRIRRSRGHPFTELGLTPKGKELSGLGIEICKKLIQELTCDLSPEEREQFHKTLKSLQQKMLNELELEKGQLPDWITDKVVPLKW
jgi:DNA-binding MarR family transcriptional regulator